MANRYVCWDPTSEDDPGESPKPRHIVDTIDVEWAAETYAEREWGNTDPYENTTVHVRDAAGTVHVVDITVEYAPSFSGTTREGEL